VQDRSVFQRECRAGGRQISAGNLNEEEHESSTDAFGAALKLHGQDLQPGVRRHSFVGRRKSRAVYELIFITTLTDCLQFGE